MKSLRLTLMDHVILVDESDIQVGTMEKLAAHQEGRLHRAFSVFIFHPDGRVMLQQRALTKYHSGGLWTNTCCSHPRPGESVLAAAHRRLPEEMGFDTDLRVVGAITYHAEVGNGLIEHEFDHLLIGEYAGEPVLSPDEAAAWQWQGVAELSADLKLHPEKYTYWLWYAFDDLITKR